MISTSLNYSSAPDRFVCVQDFEVGAQRELDKKIFAYYNDGADDGITGEDNKTAYQSWKLRPRLLVDVSKRDLSTKILGKPLSIPFGVAPMGYLRLAHTDGELAVAKACQEAGTIFTVSLIATKSYEEIAEAAPGARKWAQIVILQDRKSMSQLIQRAESCGFEAIVVTVDGQYRGNRRSWLRTPFDIPKDLRLGVIDPAQTELTYARLKGFHETYHHGPTWDDIKWVKSSTKLPVVVKGVLNPQDAELAVKFAVDAVWISNHAGRHLDGLPPTVHVAPEIVDKIHGKCEIYVDGGITRGSDIFKVLALGVDMAFVGRSIIWGLPFGGQAGVGKVFEILKHELDVTMALSGTPRISDIKPEHVRRSPN